ncbi:amidase domain-containing protein [Clostridium sp. ATCC 25772]|uniref:Putative amidase domain-containing protein n=1 Tax=Clostridium senegalense TaxID=1465809 RepID=A0A6M0H1F8_9CLOT|nr:amidase domain-containing protein [Clostridium sp. ATCC 25772]NEU04347.1 hypothetical protein [Clostridium senegalense]
MKIKKVISNVRKKLLLKEKKNQSMYRRYNREAAKNYAEAYAESPNISEYPIFKENDCANFVCQALKAGGIDMVGQSYDSYKEWFCYTKDEKQLKKISLTWRSARYFRKYWGNENGAGNNKALLFKEITVDYALSHFNEIYNMLDIGDVIQYGDIKNNNYPYHTQIIHAKEFNINLEHNDLFVAQHSINRKNVSLYEYLKLLQDKDKRIIYIYHI